MTNNDKLEKAVEMFGKELNNYANKRHSDNELFLTSVIMGLNKRTKEICAIDLN